MRTMRPSNPSSRSASAVFAPARAAPTITWVWLSGISRPSCEGQKLLAGAGVVADEAVKCGGDGVGALLLDAAQGHAEGLGLDHHPDALGRELLLEPAGDLGGQPLLDLEGAGEEVDYAGELRETEDAFSWQVPHVGHAHEREQVVLAKGVERDGPGHHQLVVAAVVGEARGIEGRRGEQLGVHGGDPPGCLAHALVTEIRTESREQISRRALGGDLVHTQLDGGARRGRSEGPEVAVMAVRALFESVHTQP